MMVIYGIRQLLTGKIYVGKTSAPLSKRIGKHVWLAEHGSPLPIHRSIRKYGIDSFEVICLATASTAEELNVLERRFIADFNSCDPKCGYNLTAGGDGKQGFKVSAVTKAKISAANKGNSFSKESRKNMSVAHLGKVQPLETRRKRAATLRAMGHKPPVGAHKGHHFSEESKRLISERTRLGIKAKRLGISIEEVTQL